MKQIFLSILVSTLVACGVTNIKTPDTKKPATQGDEKGNGGDYLPSDYQSIWFWGKDTVVNYCIDVAPNFGVDERRASEAVTIALFKWGLYIEDKKLQPEFQFGWKKEDSCKNASVIFYFGVQNPSINSARARFHNPVAFSLRTADEKGFVWLAPRGTVKPEMPGKDDAHKFFPDWHQPYNLEGMLIHEIGHIYGNSHVAETIMKENIAANLLHDIADYGDKAKAFEMLHIDQFKDLAVCIQCPTNYGGYLGYHLKFKGSVVDKNGKEAPYDKEWDNQRENFKILFGREPVGEIKSPTILLNMDFEGEKLLMAGDSLSTETFTIETVQEVATAHEYGDIFKHVKKGDGSIITYWRNSGGYLSYGILTTRDGRKLSVTVQRNMPITVKKDTGMGTHYFPVGGKVLVLLNDINGTRPIFSNFKVYEE